MTIVNGEIDRRTYQSAFPGPPDRVIKLPNFSLQLEKTPDGGWSEDLVMYEPPDGGSGAGRTMAELSKQYPWVCEQLWRRVIELEDELRALRKAISYKEPS